MANTIITNQVITNEALAILENSLTFTKYVNRNYDDSFGVSGAKIGTTLNIRKPNRFVTTSGPALSLQNINETSIPLVLNNQQHVDFSFSSSELKLSVDDFSQRYIRPAIATLANKIDSDGLLMATLATYNSVGTPGTAVNAALPVLLAGAKLDQTTTPRDGLRSIVWDPISQANMIDGLKGLFNAPDKISEQYNTGNMGKALGFRHSMDQNVVSRTTGPQGGAPAVNGAAQSGSTLVTDGWTAAAALRLNVGDVFTVAGVSSVNPQSRQSTGVLQQFVVTANVSSDAAGNATIPISPAIVASGAFQNVTGSPADNALLTVVGTSAILSPQNLAYHRDAFTLACADLPLPGGTDMAARSADKQIGLSVRIVRAYDIQTDTFPCRLDILYGWGVLYPEWACRIMA